MSGLPEQPAQTLIRKYGNRRGEACQNVTDCHDRLFFSGEIPIPTIKAARLGDGWQ
jgi:hypothetical protein